MALEADPDNQVPVTQWGANPIWYTTPVKSQPTVDDASVELEMRFEGVEIAKHSLTAAIAVQRAAAADGQAAAEAERVSVDDFRKSDEQLSLKPNEVTKVDIAAFPVNCDFDRDLVYADVEFKETDSYSKMVKLALARFQPYSAPYAFLSPVISWVFHAIGPERTIAYGVVSEINEDPMRSTQQMKFVIGGVVPGNLQEGFRKNSLEVSLFDGKNAVSELEKPMRIEDSQMGFRIPLRLLERLKHPNVHIAEFEYIGNTATRLVFALTVPIDMASL